jgi:phosphoglycolate phosphatase-like HAD superfamily hydrolase
MTKPPKGCVIFDIDGVLVDSKGMYIRAIAESLEAAGVAASVDDVSQTLTPDVGRWVHALKRRYGLQVTDGVVRSAREFVADRGWNLVRPCASPRGLLEFLEAEAYVPAVVSNAPLAYVRRVIDRLDLTGRFGPVLSCSDRRIDKGRGLALAVEKAGADAAASVYIGDTGMDVMHARSAGVRAVVLFGEFSWDYPDLAMMVEQRPDLVARTLEEVKQWLKEQG